MRATGSHPYLRVDTPFTFTLTWASVEQYAEWVRDVFVELADTITEHAPERSDRVYETVTEAARAHAADDGTLMFDNLALMGAGQRPGDPL